MLVDRARLVAALGLPAGTALAAEPLSERPGAPERVRFAGSAGPMEVIVRRGADGERAANNIAVLEALNASGIAGVPRLLAIVDGAAVEESPAGLTALSVVPPAGSAEAAMAVLAALHEASLREGLRWGSSPASLFPPEELPLHRLGFAGPEREAARAPLEALRDALLASPFGFTHGRATAAHVLLAPGAATLVDFESAGFGAQLFDTAAFLLTAGLSATERADLARHYARLRGLAPDATAELIDLVGIRWAIDELLSLPRRLIESLGDEAGSEAIRLAATRIERGLREPAGGHPVAAAIRAALWPA